MSNYTIQAKSGIKGEAYFESLICDYALPHRIAGATDVGIDYICEWAFEDKPTGILFAVQVKTFALENATIKCLNERDQNGLVKHEIRCPTLNIESKTLEYWKGLGIPVYLFAVVRDQRELNCYYKRYTPLLTSERQSRNFSPYTGFCQVNDGALFMAFSDMQRRIYGFARDLYIDYMRCSYSKGSIAHLDPRTIGLDQWQENGIFADLFQEYQDKICATYNWAKGFLESHCEKGKGPL